MISSSLQATIFSICSLDEIQQYLDSRDHKAAVNGSLLFLADIDGVLLDPWRDDDYSNLAQAAKGQHLLSEKGDSRKLVRIIRRIDQQQHVLGFTERSSRQLPGGNFTGQELLQTSLALYAAEFRGYRFKSHQIINMPLAKFPHQPSMRKLETLHGCRTVADDSFPVFDEDFRPYAIVKGVTPRDPVICENVVYTNYIKKGYVLFLLLRQHFVHDTTLSLIVAVDDQQKNLKDMERSVMQFNRISGANLRFLGLHYQPGTPPPYHHR